MNQANSLGEALKHEKITHIVSSDLKRAERTASAIAEHHPNVPVVTERLLREQDFGDLEGKPWRFVWAGEKTDLAAHNGESKEAMRERANAAWDWVIQHASILDQSDDLFIVIVSHGLFLGALFQSICTFYNTSRPPDVVWHNTAYTRFSVNHERDPHFFIERMNETSHLTSVQRQKGGVGSSKYDETQKNITDFIKPVPKDENVQGNSSLCITPS
jgi:broad specificity phosphatase PhoE